MSTIIRLYTIDRGACVGFLQDFVPDRLGRDRIQTTHNPELAQHFASVADALEAWRQTHPFIPRRLDGEPNRPLTAWSAEMINHEHGKPVPDAFGSTLSQHE